MPNPIPERQWHKQAGKARCLIQICIFTSALFVTACGQQNTKSQQGLTQNEQADLAAIYKLHDHYLQLLVTNDEYKTTFSAFTGSSMSNEDIRAHNQLVDQAKQLNKTIADTEKKMQTAVAEFTSSRKIHTLPESDQERLQEINKAAHIYLSRIKYPEPESE